MPSPPRSAFIMPDPAFQEAGETYIVRQDDDSALPGGGWGTTPGAALYPDVGYPSSKNRGAAAVAQHGWPKNRQGFRYRILASGGVWSEGTWGWRLDEDLDPSSEVGAKGDKYEVDYFGANDSRYHHHPDSPIMGEPGLDSSAPDVIGDSKTLAHAFSPVLGREIVMFGRGNSSYELWVAYHDTPDAHPALGTEHANAVWTKSSTARTDMQWAVSTANLSTNTTPLGMTDLRDGRFILLAESADKRDFDVFTSEDGINWSIGAKQILARFSNYGPDTTAGTMRQVILKRSGDYLRIVFTWVDWQDDIGDGIKYYMRSLVSSDNGATWREVSDFTTPADWQPQLRAGGAGNTMQPWLYAMAPVDNDAGEFLLIWFTGLTAISCWRGSGMSAWEDTGVSEALGAAVAVHSIHADRGPEYIYFFRVETPGAVTYRDITITLIDPRDIASEDSYKYTSTLTGTRTMRYMPRVWASARCGHYLATSWVPADDNSTNDDGAPSEVGMGYVRWGGWDRLPVEERDHPRLLGDMRYQHQPGGLWSGLLDASSLWVKLWDAWMGEPDDLGTSQWTKTGSSVGTWYLDTYQISNSDDRGYFTYTDGAPVYSWGYSTSTSDTRLGSCVEVIVKPTVSQNGDNSLTYIGVQFQSYDVNGGSGNGVRWNLRFDPNTGDVRFIDTGTGPIDVTYNVPTMTDEYHHYRVALQPMPWESTDDPAVVVWHRAYEQADSRWTVITQGKLGPTPLAVQALSWGHYAGWGGVPNARESFWKRVGILGPHDGGGTRNETETWHYPTASDPDGDFPRINFHRGRLMTHDATLIRDNVYARVSGGSAFMGDVFDADVVEAYGPDNIARLDSPRVQYRAGSLASGVSVAHVVYDAEAGGTFEGRQWMHGASAVFGYRGERLYVDYAGNTAFTSPVTATLDTRYRAGHAYAVAGAIGHVLGLSNDLAAALPGIMRSTSGRLGGPQWYLKVAAVAAGGSSSLVGSNYRVLRHVEAANDGEHSYELDSPYDLSGLIPPGSSVSLFCDRAATFYDPATIKWPNGRYMRLRTDGSINVYGPTDGRDTGQQQIGTFVPGTSLAVTVPLDWTHTDSENGNTTEHRTASAIRWTHSEGPAQRVWEGRVVGDVSEWRETLRGYLRRATAYDGRALVLITDDRELSDPERLVLGVVSGGAQFTNAGWRWDGERWVPVGDLRVKLTEEV